MKEIKVTVHPDNKTVDAYDYGPTVVLIYPFKVQDSDMSIVTKSDGFRFKRKITGETNPLFFQYHRI